MGKRRFELQGPLGTCFSFSFIIIGVQQNVFINNEVQTGSCIVLSGEEKRAFISNNGAVGKMKIADLAGIEKV
jgi:hypothetical protein